MNKRSPRKSALSGLTPTTPVPARVEALEEKAETVETSERLERGERVAVRALPETVSLAASQPVVMRKVGLHLPAHLVDEARSAYFHTSHATGETSFSQWCEQAIADRLTQARHEFNHDAPFMPMAAGSIRTGRPVSY